MGRAISSAGHQVAKKAFVNWKTVVSSGVSLVILHISLQATFLLISDTQVTYFPIFPCPAMLAGILSREENSPLEMVLVRRLSLAVAPGNAGLGSLQSSRSCSKGDYKRGNLLKWVHMHLPLCW